MCVCVLTHVVSWFIRSDRVGLWGFYFAPVSRVSCFFFNGHTNIFSVRFWKHSDDIITTWTCSSSDLFLQVWKWASRLMTALFCSVCVGQSTNTNHRYLWLAGHRSLSLIGRTRASLYLTGQRSNRSIQEDFSPSLNSRGEKDVTWWRSEGSSSEEQVTLSKDVIWAGSSLSPPFVSLHTWEKLPDFNFRQKPAVTGGGPGSSDELVPSVLLCLNWPVLRGV